MPLIPWTALIQATGRLVATEAAASLVNPVLDAYCTALPVLRLFRQDALNFRQSGLGDVISYAGSVVDDFICPNLPPPPASAAPGTYASGCNSFGSDNGFYQQVDAQGAPLGPPLVSNRTWTCGDNIGIPIGAPFFANATPGGASWGYFITLRRADGSTHVRELGATTSDPVQSKYTLTEVNFNPCPGCTAPPVLPPRPIRPSRPTPPIFPPIPQFPVTINLPQLPGLPPVSIPIRYAPVAPGLNINAPITLAPVFNANPSFNFTPTIELSLGGISIGGGGYPEPIPDVEDLCPGDGGNCPDPCTPTDYVLIREIAFEELDKKFPPARPFSLQTISLPASNSRTFVLPPFTRYVNITIVEPPPNVRGQFGGALGQEVFYNGWYSFGASGSASERIPLHYNFVSVPIPPGVTQFTYTVYLGGTASVTIGYSVEG